eukprot:764992-Hanusia_phi.AAC.3
MIAQRIQAQSSTPLPWACPPEVDREHVKSEEHEEESDEQLSRQEGGRGAGEQAAGPAIAHDRGGRGRSDLLGDAGGVSSFSGRRARLVTIKLTLLSEPRADDSDRRDGSTDPQEVRGRAGEVKALPLPPSPPHVYLTADCTTRCSSALLPPATPPAESAPWQATHQTSP